MRKTRQRSKNTGLTPQVKKVGYSGGGLGWADENLDISRRFLSPVDSLICCAEGGDFAWEFRMDAISQDCNTRKYTTAQRAHAWFLGRSRDNWKQKYKRLKIHAKRLQNRVSDATRSRENWRERVRRLEA